MEPKSESVIVTRLCPRTMSPSIYFSAIFLAVCSGSYAQVIPIPGKPHGVVYGDGLASATLQLEVFTQVMCKDSKKAWKSLKHLTTHYGRETMRMTLYQFPLPYHQYAFLATQVRTYMHGRTVRVQCVYSSNPEI